MDFKGIILSEISQRLKNTIWSHLYVEFSFKRHQSYRGQHICGSAVKHLPASAGDLGAEGSILGSGRSPGGGNSNFRYSCLENPMDRGAWQAIVHGLTKS